MFIYSFSKDSQRIKLCEKRKENRCHGFVLVVGYFIGYLPPHTDSLVTHWTFLQQKSETSWTLLTAMSSSLHVLLHSWQVCVMSSKTALGKGSDFFFFQMS